MIKLLMLKGLPASGKSTFARTLVDQGCVRVNKDDIRAMLHNSKWSKGNERYVLKLRDHIIRTALSEGKSVVVDDTNFAPIHEVTLKEIAQNNQVNFDVKFFDTPLEECIERDLRRSVSVGERVIRKMYDEYLKPAPLVYVPPVGKTRAVICDIDGTLAHMTGRSPYDETRVLEDTVDEDIRKLLDFYNPTHTIILLSGRHDTCREDTEKWLLENNVYYNHLFMRKGGDDRKDNVIKKELFDEYIRDNYRVAFVLDDRTRVVNMWREIGLKCFQVAAGDF